MNNVLMLAQNSKDDYVQQACAAAMSLLHTTPDVKISLITNNKVPDRYKQLFDNIIDIPWHDHAANEEWKISNRWKIYHASPYDEAMVLDTDMLVLQDITSWFDFLKNYNLYYTSNVYTYRGEKISSDYYRKTFTKNNLPNLYSGLHWFKKTDLAHEFYTWLEIITNNWQQFYKIHAGGKIYQKTCSMDVNAAIACSIMDCESSITNYNVKYPTFTHMKYHVQNWQKSIGSNWQDRVGVYFDSKCNLKVGNYQQTGIFHYTEKNFLNENIITTYEKALDI